MLALMTSFCTLGMAQERKGEKENEEKIEVPTAIVNAFKKEFPNVRKVSWSDEDGDFEAEFKWKGTEASATYDLSGHRKEIETEIKADELPSGVMDFITKNYSKQKVTEIAKIINDKDVVMFEVEISANGKSSDLLFDTSGKLITK